ncbi:MAG: hypothetical protein R2856_23400 [Caldilineaceae bacterium]
MRDYNLGSLRDESDTRPRLKLIADRIAGRVPLMGVGSVWTAADAEGVSTAGPPSSPWAAPPASPSRNGPTASVKDKTSTHLRPREGRRRIGHAAHAAVREDPRHAGLGAVL